MSDQASVLRSLMERRSSAPPVAVPTSASDGARTIAVTSGKGGVGKTNVALNLAIALAATGSRVCLLDANLGLGNVDLLCGLNGYWNLSHVMTAARQLRDVILQGPGGISVISGVGRLANLADSTETERDHLFSQLAALETDHDFLLVDTGSGLHRPVRRLAAAADVVLIITTPEPTSVADAYAALKAFSSLPDLTFEVLVNQAESPAQANAIIDRLRHTARLFLRTEVSSAGWIPRDHHVPQAVSRRRPLLNEHPRAPASQAVQRLSDRLKKVLETRPGRGGFFSRVCDRRAEKAA